MRLLTKAGNVFDRTNTYFTYLASAIVIFVMLFVSADVILRYLLNRPIQHVLQITEHLLLYMTFLAVAWVLKKEAHVKMDMIINLINPVGHALVNIVTSIVGAIICLVVTWYGFSVTWDYFTRGINFPGVLPIPQAPILVIIPISYLLLFVQFLRRTYGYLGSWRALRVQQDSKIGSSNNYQR